MRVIRLFAFKIQFDFSASIWYILCNCKACWEEYLRVIRKTEKGDMPCVIAIYQYAREQMRLGGNPHQWYDRFPTENTVLEDVQRGNSYVIETDGVICGVFAFIIGEDPTYKEIAGQWKNDEPYGTIHRLASSGKERGIFRQCLQYCESKVANIRIDTHRDNKIMQHLIQKNGFDWCGIIYVNDGSERLAYQKVVAK